jgi:hypothetical protein
MEGAQWVRSQNRVRGYEIGRTVVPARESRGVGASLRVIEVDPR